jgi:hypothetical protein
MSQSFLDILTFSVAAGAALIYIHTLEVEEAKRKAVEAERREVEDTLESEDRMLETLESRFSIILEEKLREK